MTFRQEIIDLLAELATDLGEGLTVTFHESAASNIDPDANVPGATTARVFDPATQTYSEDAAVAAGGAERTTTVPCVPPDLTRSLLVDGEGSASGDGLLVVSIPYRDDGSQLVPKVGMRVQIDGRFWQVTEAKDLIAGDGLCGHVIALGGGGVQPWA